MYTSLFGIHKYLWKKIQHIQDSGCQRKGGARKKEQENVGHATVFMASPPAGCDCLDKLQVSHPHYDMLESHQRPQAFCQLALQDS